MQHPVCHPLSLLIVLAASALTCLNFGCSSESSSGTSSSSSGETTTSATSSGGNADGCVKAGGVCGCAGGCNIGYHPADPPLLYECPQPCDLCGACSQQCCLLDTDASGGAGGAGGTGAGGAGGTGGTGGTGGAGGGP